MILAILNLSTPGLTFAAESVIGRKKRFTRNMAKGFPGLARPPFAEFTEFARFTDTRDTIYRRLLLFS
jgi:hypothetical protein